jgi:hypothetical protein
MNLYLHFQYFFTDLGEIRYMGSPQNAAEIRENRFSESHTLLKAEIKFYSYFPHISHYLDKIRNAC